MPSTTEILSKIFTQSPLPNELKTPKQRWRQGRLGPGAIISIIEKYSDYKCSIICSLKNQITIKILNNENS